MVKPVLLREEKAHGGVSIVLDNGLVRARVLPHAGGKVWELLDQRSGVQWVWHNPTIQPGAHPHGTSYDDNWAGGWEELFPNDAATTFEGRVLPDHGEWWSQVWEWDVVTSGPDRAELRLWLASAALPAVCEKRISLSAGVAELHVAYRITNTGTSALRFLFKQHLPVVIPPGAEIDLPGGLAEPVDLGFSGRIGKAGTFQWPLATAVDGSSVDLSRVPDESNATQEFVYVRALPESWCGVSDRERGSAIRLRYSEDVFPYVWLFMTFGGWRDLRTVVLEPCTNIPKDLHMAARNGTCACLEAGQALETSVIAELRVL